ncbi:hypothetical protein JCM8208_006312 [Rhodotorula glutinis]
MPSLSTLPLDVVRIIVDFLDPSIKRITSEAPSVSRARRDLGRQVALIAPNFVSAGTDLVWRNVVVGFHRNPELLKRILADDWMVSHVKQLHLLVGKRDEPAALRLDLARVLVLLSRLDGCILAVTPDVAEVILSNVRTAPGAADMSYLELDTTVSPSDSVPSTILGALPYLSGLERRVAVSLRISASAEIPAPAASPVLRTRHIMLEAEELKPDAHPTAAAFLASYLALFVPSAVSSVVLVSDHLPSPTLGPFLLAATHLTNLTIYSSTTDFPSLLDGMIDLLPHLEHLRALKLTLRSYNARPLTLERTDPRRSALSLALGRSGTGASAALESVALDIDFGQRGEFVEWLEEEVSGRRGEGGGAARLREWRTVEWDAMREVRREVWLVRKAVEGGRQGGRERWRLGEGESSDED